MTDANQEPVATNAPMHPMVQMLDARYVQYDKRNEHFRYMYASYSAVMKRVAEVLQSAGLYVKEASTLSITGPSGGHYEIVKDNKDGIQFMVHSQCIIYIADTNGNVYGPYQAEGMGLDKGDKAVLKAQTAALKNAARLMGFTSWGDEVEDGNPEADPKTDDSFRGQHNPTSKTPVNQPKQATSPQPQPGLTYQAVLGDLSKKWRGRLLVNQSDWAEYQIDMLAAAKMREKLTDDHQKVSLSKALANAVSGRHPNVTDIRYDDIAQAITAWKMLATNIGKECLRDGIKIEEPKKPAEHSGVAGQPGEEPAGSRNQSMASTV